jgi:hypothetical protein
LHTQQLQQLCIQKQLHLQFGLSNLLRQEGCFAHSPTQWSDNWWLETVGFDAVLLLLLLLLVLRLLLQRWLKNGGYTGGPAIEVDLSQPTPELMGTLVRFMTWYAAGRPGDPIKERSGGRKVGGRSAETASATPGVGLAVF